MTPRYAEITFVVEQERPAATPPAPRLVCARCRSDARHNLILRISFCPIHGFAAGLVEVRVARYARTRGFPE
ncbi:MAG TPA: hypothetical protein VN842_05520 [Thermoplasmata archaeon]|nr:hypothetical protein [Thermoplasmata archaeon]